MLETICFYRDINASGFVKSETEKKAVPVWPKNEYNDSNYIYDEKEKCWKAVKVLPCQGEGNVFVEFAETPIRPQKPALEGNSVFLKSRLIDIEDLSTEEMKAFLNWRKESKRFFFAQKKLIDRDGVSKNYAGAKIHVDYDALTLKISFIIFSRPLAKSQIPPVEETPALKEESLFFDMKTGKISCDFAWNIHEFLSSGKELKKLDPDHQPYHTHKAILDFFKTLESKKLPRSILKAAHEKLCVLAQKYTGLAALPSICDSAAIGENEETPGCLSEMYFLTKLPCEPKLYDVLMLKELFDIKLHFRYKRNDTKVLNRFLKKARIKNYRVLRKAFVENPQSLVSYMRLHDAGFKDINLYNRIIESQENIRAINAFNRKSFVFFCKKCIKKRGEIPAMNVLLKKVYDDNEDWLERIDSMDMFCKYYNHIPAVLRKDIFKDGFTKFNHDALSNLSYKVKNKKISFKYSLEQQKLEDDIDGYSFRLPKDSYQLCEIGTALRNCVASYAESVQKKECLIVYAQKDGQYKICIEVREKEIRQERIDRNASPNEEEKAVLYKWHERHGLKKTAE